MASTMRRPVLEEGRVQHQAYQQDFTPMPTNYDDVGNAQARAALAQGEAGMALAEVGLDVAKAADSVFQIQNKHHLSQIGLCFLHYNHLKVHHKD